MVICPSCHATVSGDDAWMMCPECGFAFEDDDAQPTSPSREAIREPIRQPARSPVRPAAPPPPSRSQPSQSQPSLSEDLVYPSEMTEDDLREYDEDPESVELPVHARHDSLFREVRAQIAERDQASMAQPRNYTPVPAPTPAPAPQDRSAPPQSATKPLRVMNIDARARKLVEAAEQDRVRGEFGSALNNMKLALTYDPNNAELRAALEELSKSAPAGGRPGSKVAAQKTLLSKALEAEKLGDIEGAVELLEKHLASHAKDAAAYHRLGIILAMRGKDLVRGREMVEKALSIDPDNQTYAQNLSKILTRAATDDLKKKPSGDGKRPGSMLGLFGKKK